MHVNNAQLKAGQKEVVIVGGGFGGLNAAKALANRPEVHVTLIDQRNHHLFQPLLYQVATAGLNPADIAVPIRGQLATSANVAVHLGEVTHIDLEEHLLGNESLELRYDYLILAGGSQHSYFGHPEWEQFAPGLKTLEQATEIRRRILTAFELAENDFDPERQRSLMTFVVVGGGPTGVELAGAIADISRTVLVRDFRRIQPQSARVILVEAGPRLLPAFAEELSAHAAEDLKRLGVEVRLSAKVLDIDAQSVLVNDERISCSNAFWAAGVQAAALGRALGAEMDKAGRVKVGPDLSVAGHPEVFVVGDMAHLVLPGGELLPGLAPAAIQTAQTAARNILATIHGEPRETFHYVDKGTMATIGKKKAIAQIGSVHLTGFIAWLGWLFVHLLSLVGFKNRVAVLFEWVWSYVFSKRGARLITSREWKLEPPGRIPPPQLLPEGTTRAQSPVASDARA